MVFGISIGNTCVSSAVSQSNRVSVIANAGGEHRPRSVAAKSNEDGFSVGTAAINSRNTVLFDNIVKTFEQEGGKFTLTKQVIRVGSSVRVKLEIIICYRNSIKIIS